MSLYNEEHILMNVFTLGTISLPLFSPLLVSLPLWQVNLQLQHQRVGETIVKCSIKSCYGDKIKVDRWQQNTSSLDRLAAGVMGELAI